MSAPELPELHDDVALAPLTTLEIGGSARHLARCADPASLRRALDRADESQERVIVLGGGSNVLVSDDGFAGTVIQYTASHADLDPGSGRIRVGAGYEWDAFVLWTLDRGLVGLECLSGIPGWVGAAPIQNIGAYGREVGEFVTRVRTVDLSDGTEREFGHDECAFAYRDSFFKRQGSGRYCVVEVELALSSGGTPHIAYEELARRLATRTTPPTAREVRQAVLDIRRGKSMVLDADDPNRRSAGSFFTNPVIDAAGLGRLLELAGADADRVPRFEVGPGAFKVPAAWLIEHAGFPKGHTRGRVGLSTAHVLALVNHGDATAAELLALAREIRDGVLDRFGVRLVPEPVPLGFDPEETADLWG